MSKKKTKVAEVTTTGDIEANGIKIDGDMYWEGLVDAKNGIAKEILSQQHLVLELSKKYESTLNNDPSTYAAVEGLMKSIQDLANDIPAIMNRHQISGTFKSGKLDSSNIDDTLEYLEIASQYISISENLSNLISTAYLDIFAKLSLPLDDLSATIKEGNTQVDKVIKGGKLG